MPRIEIESQDVVLDAADVSTASFDRIAFAEHALALVRPPGTRVAIREGARRVHLEAGRQWGSRWPTRWAVLSVPKNASRRAIADAVLAMAPEGVRPYALEVLLSSCEEP